MDDNAVAMVLILKYGSMMKAFRAWDIVEWDSPDFTTDENRVIFEFGQQCDSKYIPGTNVKG